MIDQEEKITSEDLGQEFDQFLSNWRSFLASELKEDDRLMKIFEYLDGLKLIRFKWMNEAAVTPIKQSLSFLEKKLFLSNQEIKEIEQTLENVINSEQSLVEGVESISTSVKQVIRKKPEESKNFSSALTHLAEGRQRCLNIMSIVDDTEEHKELRKSAGTDELTKLPVRRIFDENLLGVLSNKKRNPERYVALLFIDIDFFKQFNDKYDHLVGDEILKIVAKTMKELIRSGDSVYRWGGEEFAIICEGGEAVSFAERLRKSIEEIDISAMLDKKIDSITVSIGVSEARENDTPKSIVGRADETMYTAKREGRNCVYFDGGGEISRIGKKK